MVWSDGPSGLMEIFFSFSTDNGLSFSQPDNISESTGNSVTPQIATNGDNVYILWQENTLNPNNSDIFFSFSTDNGLSFSQPKNISKNTGGVNTGASLFPQIDVE